MCRYTSDGEDVKIGGKAYMYTYVYVCMYVCMYVCVCVCVFARAEKESTIVYQKETACNYARAGLADLWLSKEKNAPRVDPQRKQNVQRTLLARLSEMESRDGILGVERDGRVQNTRCVFLNQVPCYDYERMTLAM